VDDLGTGWEHKRAGRLADAAACFRRFINSHPDRAEGWAALGVVAFKQQDLDEAIRCFRRSLELKAGSVEVLTNLGVAYAVKRDFAAAERTLRQAAAVQPPSLAAYRNLGHVLSDQGKHAEAVEAHRQALRLSPADIDILGSLGNALERANRAAEAIEPAAEAVRLAPLSVKLRQILGTSLARAQRFDEAEAEFRRALELDPTDARSHNGLGIIQAETQRLAEAEVSCREAIRLDPHLVEAYQNLGNILRDQDRHDEAIASYEAAIGLRPDLLHVHNNLGIAFGRIGRYEDSRRAYDRELALDPSHADARKNRAMIMLLLGDYVQGFAEFERRWECRDFARPGFTQPLWKGESIAGRTILLMPEQGLGDTIQFIRFAPKVKALGARVVFRCPKPLLKLFEGFPGIDVLVPEGEPLPAFDVYVPLISLAAIFRTGVEDVPAILPVPYLRADPELVGRWSDRLGPRESGELRVGISWQGNSTYGGDRYRSVPLAAFLPLAAVPGVKLISLQKGHGVEQIAPLADRLPLVDFGEGLDRDSGPFQDTAALMTLLDLMITINSAPVHLAGALGVPTWLALSTASEWRWIAGREDAPWYPTVRVFRQAALHDWDEVFGRMARALAELAARPSPAAIARPISVMLAPGELIDKITILEIKAERITDPGKLANVRHELRLLTSARDRAVPPSTELDELTAALRRVNLALWDVEDALRICEHHEQFDAEFIRLARSVYKYNDRRAAYKRRVNELLGSSILEEKSYSQSRT
jgi:tetratricopeptide (TPR) repeat protein